MTQIGEFMKYKKLISEIKKKNPKVAIILGSGFADAIRLEDSVEYDYNKLGLKFSSVGGHSRKMIVGTYKGVSTIIISRIHYYESGDSKNVFRLYGLLYEIGIEKLILTTATGGINEEFEAGDLMLIRSHINQTGTNPLIAIEPIKFIDVNKAYDQKLLDTAKKAAKRLKIKLYEGIHIQVSGPSYETFAEVNAFRRMGADTVSMSTALDVICASYFDMKVLAFAGVTNKALTEQSTGISHEEVLQVGEHIAKNFTKIIDGIWLKI